MKETGIIMSGDHPRKIIDLLKTQTRRVIKLACELDESYDHKWVTFSKKDNWWLYKGRSRITSNLETFVLDCPYGQVGDRLWVKETHYRYGHWELLLLHNTPKTNMPREEFVSDKEEVRYLDNPPQQIQTKHSKFGWFKRPSIFMFKKDTRITLEITEVRVERVQGITEGDAKAEGVNPFLLDKLKGGTRYKMLKTYHHEFYPLIDHADKGEIVVFECPNMGYARLHHAQWKEKQDPVFRIPAKEAFDYLGALEPDYKNGFRILWDSLNAKKYPWPRNPWDWCITFRRIP